MRHSPSFRIVLVSLGLALAATAIHGQVENRVARRGGPRDWSANRVIATRFGPDLDANVDRDWRTYMKHEQLERARANRAERLDWLGVLTRGVMKKPAPVNGSKLDWNLATGGYGSVIGSPAKYSSLSGANCADVIYFTVDQPGSAIAVNVIAITNAYALPCPGNAGGATPTVKFGLAMAYGTATSAVPSLDGKVLYVLESRPSANGGIVLHAINVNSVSGTGAYNFTTGVWSGARALAAPTGLAGSEQLFQITYTGVTNNNASPYLDYATNQMFFGDSAGRIHRIINVDKTTATRDTTNGFPVQCGTQQLQSPVFVNGQVITTSADGRVYRINMNLPPPYTCIASAQGGAGTAGGVGGGLSAPIIDISNTNIIVAGNNANGFGVRGVGFYDFMFASGATQVAGVEVGAGSTTIAPQSPSFDDAFWSTNNGNMYVPGAPSSNVNGGVGTYLIRVPYNGTAVSNPTGYATLRSSGAAQSVATSPVTEFLTGSSLANPDFIFVGGATGNYRYMNRISSGFGGSEAAPAAMANFFQPVGGGGVSSGIIIDQRTTSVTGSTATANIYFGTIGVVSSLTQSRIIQLAQQF